MDRITIGLSSPNMFDAFIFINTIMAMKGNLLQETKGKLLEQIQMCTGLRHRARELKDAQKKLDATMQQIVDYDLTCEVDLTAVLTKDTSPENPVHTEPDSDNTQHIDTLPTINIKCRSCGPGGTMRLLAADALMSCDNCGESSVYMETSREHIPPPYDKKSSQYSYKRENHFIEWLNSIQGRPSGIIPAIILSDCCGQIKKDGTPTHLVTPKVIRSILKKTNHRNYYDSAPEICARLTGVQPSQFSPDQEESLKAMFVSIQQPFEIARSLVAPERRNFLSYSYCMFKFCQLRGLDAFLVSFPLLKGRDKLFKQDMIFRNICQQLNWQFIPSV
jgi:hypothetical protein